MKRLIDKYNNGRLHQMVIFIMALLSFCACSKEYTLPMVIEELNDIDSACNGINDVYKVDSLQTNQQNFANDTTLYRPRRGIYGTYLFTQEEFERLIREIAEQGGFSLETLGL